MDKENHINIHETAFVTSTFRALDEKLSHDRYAKLWNNPKTKQWITEYLNQVSSEEIYAHCLRNRYFLDLINKLWSTKKIDVLVNFGSGFSMYPFLLDNSLVHIEIDKPEIINYKHEKVKTWQKQHKLPKRTVHFIGVDFTKDYTDTLLTAINPIIANKSSFILIEGVLFFLNRKETDALFGFFDRIQNKGDYIGSASFQDTLKDTSGYKKLLEFFEKKVSKSKGSIYQTIQDDYYHSIENYKLIDHQDFFSLSKTYGHIIKEPHSSVINENFYLLKKVK